MAPIGGAIGGGTDGGTADGGADWFGARAELLPDAAPTAVWHAGDNWLMCVCKHCSAALPPVGTPEQTD